MTAPATPPYREVRAGIIRQPERPGYKVHRDAASPTYPKTRTACGIDISGWLTLGCAVQNAPALCRRAACYPIANEVPGA